MFSICVRLCLVLGLLITSHLALGQCVPPVSEGPWKSIDSWRVIDGDTLHFEANQRLRLAMVNTPEIGRNGRPNEPFALAAKQAVNDFMATSKALYWQVGLDERQQPARDRYGRWLGQVYNAQGDWLAATLVAKGLAFATSFAPNPAPDCLWRLEAQAKQAGKGVWSSKLGLSQAAADMHPPEGGFILLNGEVTKISNSQYYWYLELDGDVVVRLNKRRWTGAGGTEPQTWLNRQIQTRGWLHWRKLSASQQQRNFKRGMIKINHPHMLAVTN